MRADHACKMPIFNVNEFFSRIDERLKRSSLSLIWIALLWDNKAVGCSMACRVLPLHPLFVFIFMG